MKPRKRARAADRHVELDRSVVDSDKIHYGENDVPMLTLCGRSIAMAHSAPCVRQARIA
jgi:phosphoserine phosphatase